VLTEMEPKSISRETTFDRDLSAQRDRAELSAVFTELCEGVSRDLKRKGYVGKTIGLKLRYDNFKTVTRDKTIEQATDDAATIRRACRGVPEARVARSTDPVAGRSCRRACPGRCARGRTPNGGRGAVALRLEVDNHFANLTEIGMDTRGFGIQTAGARSSELAKMRTAIGVRKCAESAWIRLQFGQTTNSISACGR
jgi:hypothetical protein